MEWTGLTTRLFLYMKAIAITDFDHYGTYKKGDSLKLSDNTILQLEAKGLVRVIRPKMAVGEKSSALPAAPASLKQTAKKSTNGVKKAKTEK